MTRKEALAKAKELNVAGRNAMNTGTLIRKVREAEARRVSR